MEAPDPIKAAAYVSAFAREQAEEREILDEQRRRIEEFVAGKGWELTAVHEDDSKPGRPALARLLADLSGVDKLVVTAPTRFMGWPRGAPELMGQLEVDQVDLVMIDYDLDTGTPSGRMLSQVISELADGNWRDWRPENLRKPGFEPATLIDVGVANGTPLLYKAFPDVHLVLVEPLEEFEPRLKKLVSQHGGEYLLTAVGASEGVTTIDVEPSMLVRSSMLKRSWAASPDGLTRREVPITTLDRLREERGWNPPFGLKVDTEGFEAEVIRGSAALLDETQFVIAEVSVTKRFEGSYSFAEFIALMDSHGFRLCDILLAARSSDPRDRLLFMDGVFRRD